MDSTELQEKIELRNELVRERNAINIQIDELNKSIKAKCKHPTTRKRNYYSEGEYDYTGTSNTWDECLLCGEALNLKKKSTGKYG